MRKGGHQLVAEALLARANLRWENSRSSYPFTAGLVLPFLSRLVAIDATLLSLGVPYDSDLDPLGAAPASPGWDWLRQIRWGADSLAAASRLLLLGQGIGAGAIIRQQVERWSANRAAFFQMSKVPSEPKSHYYARVWGPYWEIPLSVEKLYETVSELVHGRGPMLPLVTWESEGLYAWPPPADVVPPLDLLARFGTLPMQQLLAVGMDVARRAKRDDLEQLLWQWPRTVSPFSSSSLDRLVPGLWPLGPAALTINVGMPLLAAQQAYHEALRDRAGLETIDKAKLAVLAFLDRRARAHQTAVWALEQEQRQTGRLDLPALSGREARNALIAEFAILAGGWVGGDHGGALSTGASALRSAFLLWLEDDSRAMIPVRTVLESAARARTWRLKPGKAAAVEARGPRTSTRDWLSAAGLHRLGLLNAALGELSHSSPESRWDGAIKALGATREKDELQSLATARGDALDRAAYLLAIEATSALSPDLGELVQAVRMLVGLDADPAPALERWLQQAGRHGRFDFGEPTFRPVQPSDAQALDEQLRRHSPR